MWLCEERDVRMWLPGSKLMLPLRHPHVLMLGAQRRYGVYMYALTRTTLSCSSPNRNLPYVPPPTPSCFVPKQRILTRKAKRKDTHMGAPFIQVALACALLLATATASRATEHLASLGALRTREALDDGAVEAVPKRSRSILASSFTPRPRSASSER